MTYSVEFSTSAAKSLAKLEKARRFRIVGAIELLSVDPRPPGAKMLRGGDHGRWRVLVSSSPVIYTIQDNRLIVLVLRVAQHREVYSAGEQ